MPYSTMGLDPVEVLIFLCIIALVSLAEILEHPTIELNQT